MIIVVLRSVFHIVCLKQLELTYNQAFGLISDTLFETVS